MRPLLSLLLILTIFSCEETPEWETVPSGAGALTPFFFKGFSGDKSYLLWQESGAYKSTTLKFAAWEGKQWGKAREIWTGRDWFVNWADFPAMCEFREGQWAAHFLEKSAEDTYAYGVRLLFSNDGGDLWRGPVIPHERETDTEHGFVSLLSWKKKLLAVWLDGRGYALADSLSDSIPYAGQMHLRAAQFNEQGKKEKEWLLDCLG